MNTVELIRKKRNGLPLLKSEIQFLISSYLKKKIPDYQFSAFLMAVYFRGMDETEQSALTDAMINSGKIVDLKKIRGLKVDKHSTGGVGDKTSMIIAPITAAAGVKVPMISGRGLGHTGGTLDKLESIPGFRTDLSLGETKAQIDRVGCAMIGQTPEIAPVDKRLYALRDVTATVECIPLIAASIMSKKLAEGLTGLVLDVKQGSGAFITDPERSRELAETMIRLGEDRGCPTVALLTPMRPPLPPP